MSHSHHHSNSSKNIKVAFFLNLGFAIFELIGGFLVNSVAIMSDALHDFGDSLSLGLSWVLDRKSKQPGNKKYTFGYQRYSLLGALINSIVLIAGSVFIVNKAIERLILPQQSNATGMLLFAFLGIAVNGFAAFRLKEGKTLNEKVAFWHLMEDLLGWIAVLFASLAMMVTKSLYIDPALSILITLFILWKVVKRLRETAFIFLQGAPPQISVSIVEQKLLQVDGIKSLHHTHLWSLDGEQNVFTTHVKLISSIKTVEEITAIREKLIQALKEFNLSHHTIEIEIDSEFCRFEAEN